MYIASDLSNLLSGGFNVARSVPHQKKHKKQTRLLLVVMVTLGLNESSVGMISYGLVKVFACKHSQGFFKFVLFIYRVCVCARAG